MRVYSTITYTSKTPCVVALGCFDGIHIGHRSVINKAREIANRLECDCAVWTFDEPPKNYFLKHAVPLITDQKQKRGLISRFSLKYSEQNRPTLSQYKGYEELTRYLDTQPILESFVEYAAKKGLKKRNNLIAKSRDILTRSIYSNIIYQMQGMLEHVKYINLQDPTVLKAIEVLEKGEAFP